tara:strand:+ start:140 stop:613 length:474 start_codon:yes stop_codon:yes gene_type:complete
MSTDKDYESSYRKKFPKGKDWKTPKKNPYGFCGLNESSYHGMEVVGYAKEKVVDFDPSYDGMFKDKLLVCDTRDMTRKELDFFADRMRIERNSYFLRKEESEEKVEEAQKEINRLQILWAKQSDEIRELKQHYYFDMRNKQVEIETLKNQINGGYDG